MRGGIAVVERNPSLTNIVNLYDERHLGCNLVLADQY